MGGRWPWLGRAAEEGGGDTGQVDHLAAADCAAPSWDHILGTWGVLPVCAVRELFWKESTGLLLASCQVREEDRQEGGMEDEEQSGSPLRQEGARRAAPAVPSRRLVDPKLYSTASLARLRRVACGWGFVWLKHEPNHTLIQGRLTLCGAFILK